MMFGLSSAQVSLPQMLFAAAPALGHGHEVVVVAAATAVQEVVAAGAVVVVAHLRLAAPRPGVRGEAAHVRRGRPGVLGGGPERRPPAAAASLEALVLGDEVVGVAGAPAVGEGQALGRRRVEVEPRDPRLAGARVRRQGAALRREEGVVVIVVFGLGIGPRGRPSTRRPALPAITCLCERES